MKEQLRLLVMLQKIDTAVLRKTEVIDAIPKKISAVEQSLKDSRLLYDKQRQKCEALEKKKKDKERLLDDANEKVRKLRARVSEIKNNKEYQAHIKEIESAEKERFSIEDDILSLMESIDDCCRELNTEDAKVKAEKERMGAFKKELNEDVSKAEKELDELRLGRADIVKEIDKELYSLYLKLLEIRTGLAVAEARDEICYGCNMNIPPQLFVELKKSDKLIQCPQCNRILYWKEDTTA